MQKNPKSHLLIAAKSQQSSIDFTNDQSLRGVATGWA